MKKTIMISLLLLCVCTFTQGKEFPAFFPKMKAVQEAVYLSISTDQTEAKLICRVFQGIINRDSAELFLGDDSHEITWFKYTKKPYRRPAYNVSTGENRALRTLFRNYKDRLDKLIVCDFKVNGFNWNMAVMIACAENALPVSEELKNTLVEEFGWDKEIVDIRNRWFTLSEAYDWALAELMPKLNKKITFSLGLRDDWEGFPWRLYDYAVATRSFTFWLDNHSTEGKNIIKRILNTEGYPKNSFVLGYGMHGDDLNDAINPEGWGFLVGDIFPNASFYSSFPTETFKQPEPKAVTAEKGKVYVALHWSDGDNIQFNHNATYDIFNQKGRGKVPVSMTLSPALMEIAPFILRYYYENATENDEFIGGPSGVQYIQEALYKPMGYVRWCEMNGEWLYQAGMSVTASSLRWPAQPFFNNGFVKTGVLGTIAWTNGAYRDAYDWLGMPVICTGGVVSNKKELYNYLSGVSVSENYPVFTGVYMVQAGMGGDGYPGINSVVEQLNAEFPGKYVFLKASDLMATSRQYFESVHAPYKELSIPGRIEAEDFDKGGQGVGFYDTSKSNQGGKYRTESSDFVGIGEGGTGYYVGWTATGEWLNYSVDVQEAGVYRMDINYSSTSSKAGVTVMLGDKVLTTVESQKKSEYSDYSVYVNLSEGKQMLKVLFLDGSMNLDYIDFTRTEYNLPEIQSDKTYKIVAKHSGKAIGLSVDNQVNGTSIVQKTYVDEGSLSWNLHLVGDAFYGFQSGSSKLFMTVRGNKYIQQFPFDTTVDVAKWGIQCVDENYFCITAKGTGTVLEVVDSSDKENAVLGLAPFTGADNQLFSIQEIGDATGIGGIEVVKAITYPNPFTDYINISVPAKEGGKFTLYIYTSSGNLVYSDSQVVAENVVTFTWNPGFSIPKGLFIYSLKGDTFCAGGKIVKQ